MISSIQFSQSEETKEISNEKYQSNQFRYAREIPFLKDIKQIEFKQGINILFGQNGSGKSTILSMLAAYLAAEQGGKSCVTQSWISDYFMNNQAFDYHLIHDGNPILYGNPRNQVGIIGGQLDDDFILSGIMNAQMKRSTGETSCLRLTDAIKVIIKKEAHPETIEWKIKKNNVNDRWAERLEKAEKQLGRHHEFTGGTSNTVLLDEPESGYSITWQKTFWDNIIKPIDTEQFQVIIATHSIFSLNIPGANYIEMEPGYIDRCKECIRSLNL